MIFDAFCTPPLISRDSYRPTIIFIYFCLQILNSEKIFSKPQKRMFSGIKKTSATRQKSIFFRKNLLY